jgi:hypothetical protein
VWLGCWRYQGPGGSHCCPGQISPSEDYEKCKALRDWLAGWGLIFEECGWIVWKGFSDSEETIYSVPLSVENTNDWSSLSIP